jgi:hypothetical protein
MRTALTDEQFLDQLGRYERSAFRLELQRVYTVGYERDLFDRFLAGNPEPPTTYGRFRAWYDEVAQRTASGVITERVRLFDEPPTDYQRWTRYMDRWNLEAGEVIHYLARARALEAGLLEAFEGRDWWLLDGHRLMLMTYDNDGRRTHTELSTDDNTVQEARWWRDLAIRTAQGDDG